jgi:squalene synthase HpnC
MTRDRAGTEAAPAPDVGRGLPPLPPLPPARRAAAGGADQATLAGADAAVLAAKAAAENFSVALRLLPRQQRGHLMAVYNFARTVDDVGDEAPPDQRLRLLDDLDEDLSRLYAAGLASLEPGSQPRHPAVRGLAEAVTDCAIPVQPFRDLIAANRQDQVVSRYETFDDLLGYCTLSANPVGRIVLYVFGCSTPGRAELSDEICSGLQIVEHLQDVAEDLRAGRVYVPAADMRSHGCSEQDLRAPAAAPHVRRLIAFEADRAAALISSGAPLVSQLHGAARVAVAGYIAGGRAALAALAGADYDVLAATPKPAKSRTVRELASTLVRGR